MTKEPPRPAAQRQRRTLAISLAIAAVILPLFMIGIPLLQKAGMTAGAGPGAPSWRGEYFKFDHHARPVAVDVNSDGVEDLLGPFAVQRGEVLEMRLGAFDGKTWALLWSHGPFGLEDKAMRKSKLALAGKRVVFVDYTAKATIYDLATGTQGASIALEREPMGVCSPSASGDTVWIWTPGLEPTNGVLVDAAAGTSEPRPPPEGCMGVLRTSDSEENATISGPRQAEVASRAPEIPRTTPRRALRRGPDAVALASEFGTNAPVFAGFDPESGSLRWQASLAQLAAPGASPAGTSLQGEPWPADLADGRFYWGYHVGRAHFAALDVKTGQKLWDTELPEGMTHASQYTITPSRIYLVDNRGVGRLVHVLEAATGRLVATVGTPRLPVKYDPE